MLSPGASRATPKTVDEYEVSYGDVCGDVESVQSPGALDIL